MKAFSWTQKIFLFCCSELWHGQANVKEGSVEERRRQNGSRDRELRFRNAKCETKFVLNKAKMEMIRMLLIVEATEEKYSWLTRWVWKKRNESLKRISPPWAFLSRFVKKDVSTRSFRCPESFYSFFWNLLRSENSFNSPPFASTTNSFPLGQFRRNTFLFLSQTSASVRDYNFN